jgi:hypothetical protein
MYVKAEEATPHDGNAEEDDEQNNIEEGIQVIGVGRVYMCMYVYISMYIYIHIHVCVYLYIHIYEHIYTYTCDIEGGGSCPVAESQGGSLESQQGEGVEPQQGPVRVEQASKVAPEVTIGALDNDGVEGSIEGEEGSLESRALDSGGMEDGEEGSLEGEEGSLESRALDRSGIEDGEEEWGIVIKVIHALFMPIHA